MNAEGKRRPEDCGRPHPQPYCVCEACSWAKRMITPRDAADALSVSVDVILAMLRRGELRGMLVSTNPKSRRPRYRIAQGDLAALIAGRMLDGRRPSRPRRRLEYERII